MDCCYKLVQRLADIGQLALGLFGFMKTRKVHYAASLNTHWHIVLCFFVSYSDSNILIIGTTSEIHKFK